MRYLKLLSPLALLIILIASGCYTILSHPGEEDGFAASDRNSNCLSCHPNYHDDYGYSHYYYPGYWTDVPRWGHYYAVPWWWDYYWYADDDYYYEDDVYPRSSDGEKAVRPGSRYNSDDNSYNPRTSTIRRSGDSNSGSSNSGSTTSGKSSYGSDNNSKSSNTKQKETKTKTPERKSTRRSGRWKSK